MHFAQHTVGDDPKRSCGGYCGRSHRLDKEPSVKAPFLHLGALSVDTEASVCTSQSQAGPAAPRVA